MANHKARTLISLAVLAVFGAGCARSTEKRNEPATPVAAPSSTRGGVTADDVNRAPNVPIEQLLQSKVPGIIVSRTDDGSIAIRIRGTGSLTGNNAPLYVVDGIATQPGPGGGLTGVNPYDIASIKVLKDPADLTMYGVRGANGVVVIKTKRPNQ
ncbi:MAG: TonB-dependent receptor plug domain-containing protein [bacterium]